MDSGEDKVASKNVEILKGFAAQGDTGKPRKIIMRFCVSPVEIIGTDKVEAIKLVKNELVPNEKGELKAKPTDQFETIPVGLVFRSVGYKGQAIPDVPFDDRSATIPNNLGRVLTAPKTGEQVIGDYAVGWIKRGPSGIIGTNKPELGRDGQCLIGRCEGWQSVVTCDALTEPNSKPCSKNVASST